MATRIDVYPGEPMSYRPGIPLSLYRRLQDDAFSPVELLEVKLLGQDPTRATRLTNAGEIVTWRGKTWLPVAMARSNIEERVGTQSSEADEIQMSISNVSREIARLVQHVELEVARASLWVTDRKLVKRGLRDTEAIPLTVGEVRDPVLSNEVLSFRLLNVIGIQNQINLPKRVYQAKCNYVFGGRTCGVDLNGVDSRGFPITIFKFCGDSSTSKVLTITEAIDGDPDLYESAQVIMIGGVNGLQVRPVQRVTANSVVLRVPLLQAPQSGDALAIRRVCRKTTDDCFLYLGNTLNFGGFPSVPPVRFKPRERHEYGDASPSSSQTVDGGTP